MELDADYLEREGPDEYEDPIVVWGQPYFYKEGSKMALEHGPAGDQMPIVGYVLFKITVLEEAGYTPRRGDKYTKFGNFTPDEGPRCSGIRPWSPLVGEYLFLRVNLEEDKKKLGRFQL